MELIVKTRGWYWKVHREEYQRRSITEEKPSFVGWDKLLELVEEAAKTPYFKRSKFLGGVSVEEMRDRLRRRDQALVAACFELGGRISEVLQLRREMFTVKPDRLVVEGMPIVKRYKKEREIVQLWEGEAEPSGPDAEKWHWSHKYDNWVRRRYVTKPVFAQRNVLEIPLFEPLVPYLVSWLDEIDDWLFPSYAKDKRGPMTSTRAYQILRRLGERVGLVKYDGRLVNQHITPHWFRAQRASQLASEYGWRQFRLKQFFGWVTDKEPSRYATLAPADLFESMRPDRIKLERR